MNQAVRRRGTVYLVALSTAMIVTVMGVSGLLAVRVHHRGAQLESDMITARHHARSAAELAMWYVQHDPQWAELADDERVRRFSEHASSRFTYRAGVDDAPLGETRCQPVWIDAVGRHRDARARLQVLLEPEPAGRRSQRQALLALAPLAHWPLDEKQGPAATELLGERHGVYRAVEPHVYDPLYCLPAPAFDGDTSVVEVPHDDAFMVDNGSIVFWFRTRDVDRSQGLFSKDASDLGPGGYVTIRLFNRRLRARMSTTNNRQQVRSDRIMDPDRWYHVVFTFGENGMRLYIDGELEGSGSFTGGTGPTSGGTGNTEPIAIGANAETSATGSIDGYSEPLLGSMFQVAWYNYALSDAEIRRLHQHSRLDRRYRIANLTWRERVD